MAVDKLVDSTQLDTDLTSVANAIRTKGGTSASLAFPSGFVSAVEAIPSGGGGYNIVSGDLTALFDQYAEENNMLVMDITFASDQTANVTIQHSLGSVPTEAILYPKNPVDSTLGYQIGFTFNGQFAVDRNCNRTMRWFTNYPSGGFGYSVRKDLPSLIADSCRSAYNFTQSVPTSTTITIRGGTNVETKLLAGQYKLALR